MFPLISCDQDLAAVDRSLVASPFEGYMKVKLKVEELSAFALPVIAASPFLRSYSAFLTVPGWTVNFPLGNLTVGTSDRGFA